SARESTHGPRITVHRARWPGPWGDGGRTSEQPERADRYHFNLIELAVFHIVDLESLPFRARAKTKDPGPDADAPGHRGVIVLEGLKAHHPQLLLISYRSQFGEDIEGSQWQDRQREGIHAGCFILDVGTLRRAEIPVTDLSRQVEERQQVRAVASKGFPGEVVLV